MRIFSVPLLSLLLAACTPKDDFTPQITVQPGMAAKGTALLDRYRDAASSRALAAARVHVMKPGDELGGPNAVGKPGDVMIENDEVVFVIDGLGSSAGFAESGGNLVDAADAHERKDELGQAFTYFGTFPRQGVYDALTSGVTADGSAWVQAKGRELYEDKLAVVTRYTLRPGDRALLLETTITNASDHVAEKLSLGDAIQWGGAEKVAPGKAVGFRGLSSGPYVGGIGRAVSYAITSTEGKIDAISGGSWTDTAQQRDLALKPGESASYARVFVVGLRADLASIASELTRSAGGELGAIEIALENEQGKAVNAPEGAKAILTNAAGEEVLSLRAAREAASFGGEVPPGHYDITYANGGGRKGKSKASVDAIAGKTARAKLVVSEAGRLSFRCVREKERLPTPCKATLEGLTGTSTPDFGPAHAAGPARNQVTAADGAIDVLLSPGKYRVTLSHGPEVALVQWETEVAPGVDTHADPPALMRVVDTRGYLATDFHQHTMVGADAPVSRVDRVIANVAEGVELAVASEHNVIADLEPIVRAHHLEAELVVLAGDELTTDASRHPWGHANAFPLPIDESKPRGGAPLVRDRAATQLFGELRSSFPPHVLQVNHPRSGNTGYFDLYKLDRDAGVGTDPGYSADFDALEVWNGRNVDARDSVLEDYFALLRTHHVVTPTADTDTHGIVGQEAGYPRTYVRVHDDEHVAAWDAAQTADLVHSIKELRDVVLTNGPFVRVSAAGAPIGGIAKARAGVVEVRVHVECAPWAIVDRVRIARVNTTPIASDEAAVTLKPTAQGARAADLVFTLRAPKDDAFIVIASGTSPMTPVLGGDAREILPHAITGAIWIDADGDGKSLGRAR